MYTVYTPTAAERPVHTHISKQVTKKTPQTPSLLKRIHTGFKAWRTLDLNIIMAQSRAMIQKFNNTPEDCTPFIRSY